MVNAANLTQYITFQTQVNDVWTDFKSAYAYITGLRNSEFWVAYAGGLADEYINISVRYDSELMALIPQTSRIIHGDNVYDIISPPDDVLFRHTEIKFRARRLIS